MSFAHVSGCCCTFLPGVCEPVGADDPAPTAEQSSREGFLTWRVKLQAVMRLPEGMCSNTREGIHSLLYSQKSHVPAEEDGK